MTEEMSRGLDEVAGGRQVENGDGMLRPLRRSGPEGEQGLAWPHLGHVKPHWRPRRVVLREAARRQRTSFATRRIGELSDQGLDLLAWHAPGAQEHGPVAQQGDNRRLNANRRRAGIDDNVDGRSQIIGDVPGCRGRDMA